LAKMARWLKPGGVLIVHVPYNAPYIRLKRWLPMLPVHFEAPRHLFDFSPGVLRRYFREQGFGEIDTEIGRPYSAKGRIGEALIWGVKAPGFVLHALSGGRYVYPFAGAVVCHGRKVG
ncbi:MAG: hypothetical protein WD873_08495, partial [Candidatus Hydrogenedentales bacterium]